MLAEKKDIPALKNDIFDLKEDDEDPEIKLLERLLAEKKARKKFKDYDEEM